MDPTNACQGWPDDETDGAPEPRNVYELYVQSESNRLTAVGADGPSIDTTHAAATSPLMTAGQFYSFWRGMNRHERSRAISKWTASLTLPVGASPEVEIEQPEQLSGGDDEGVNELYQRYAVFETEAFHHRLRLVITEETRNVFRQAFHLLTPSEFRYFMRGLPDDVRHRKAQLWHQGFQPSLHQQGIGLIVGDADDRCESMPNDVRRRMDMLLRDNDLNRSA